MGRKLGVTENYVASSSSSSSSSSSASSSGGGTCAASDDKNRVTQYAYTADGPIATQTAQNARTGPQVTTYTYGTTLTESAIATSNLLSYVDYPGSTSGSDRVTYTYNRQQQQASLMDQRGCVHQNVYDLLGRLTNDCVTTLGSGVDGAVLRRMMTYEVRGLVTRLTSYDNATVGSGSIVNDVALEYNPFGQLIADKQSHSGAVGGSTPMVQYAYANGSANTIRPTTLTYPNGRAITISYGTSGGINDSASRVDGLIDGGTTTLVNYSYLGMGSAVQVTYPQPSTQYTLLGSSSGNNPTTGDIYCGLDLFGRIVDSRWYNTGTNADVDRIKYGYDRASNRIWRQNPVATAAGAAYDEYYHYDGLQRLKDMQRGTLNGSNSGITSPTFGQCWTLDPTGNWKGFNEAATGSSWTTVQSRTANPVNEISGIATSVGTAWANPAYDAAGNMTSIPQPTAMATSYTATYDAWDRLVKLIDATSGGTVQVNQYDARTFRTLVLSYSAGILIEARHCYYTSGWQEVEQRVGISTIAERQFVWGKRYIDDLVLRDRSSERLYALQDAGWNLTGIIDSLGDIQERCAYSAYGSPAFLTSTFVPRPTSSYAWEILYCSYRFDVVTGLYIVGFRCYHAQVGNWVQVDPLGYADSMNLYFAAFILNSTDPDGCDPPSGKPTKIVESQAMKQVLVDLLQELDEAKAFVPDGNGKCKVTLCEALAQWIERYRDASEFGWDDFVTFAAGEGGTAKTAGESIGDLFTKRSGLGKPSKNPNGRAEGQPTMAECKNPHPCWGFNQSVLANGSQDLRHFMSVLYYGRIGHWADNVAGSIVRGGLSQRQKLQEAIDSGNIEREMEVRAQIKANDFALEVYKNLPVWTELTGKEIADKWRDAFCI